VCFFSQLRKVTKYLRLFHQLKARGEDRFPDKLSSSLQSLSSAYEHIKILHSTEEGSSIALRAFLTWSKGLIKPEDVWSNYPFPRNTHVDINILTVTVSVRMRRDIHSHPVPDFSGLMDGRLSSCIDTAKERKPDKIVLLLLVQGMEYFLPWLMDTSPPAAQTTEVQAVYEQIMGIFQLFGGIQSNFPKECLMVWDSPEFDDHLLGTLAERFPPSDRISTTTTLYCDEEDEELLC